MFILGLILIIAIVYYAAGPNHRMSFGPARDSEAEELLKKRFVTGEIDETTYKTMLHTLRSK